MDSALAVTGAMDAPVSSSLADMGAMEAPVSSWLADMGSMDAAMSSSLGVTGPLLRKLDSLLPLNYRLRGLLKDRVVLLRADLEEISVALVEQSMVDSPNEMAKYWMNEVRELCYDIEDFIDDMMLTHADAKMRSVQSFKVGRVKIPWLSNTVRPCTRAAKIAELRDLVREAIERHGRYLDGCTSSSRSLFTVYGHIPFMYAEAANYLVGIDDAKTKLIKWITDKEQHPAETTNYLVGVNDAKTKLIKWLTNEKEQQLKMVAITGHAGVGKTTLAKQLSREIGQQFECRAFVRASRKPDMRRLLEGILSQVQQHRCPSNSYTVQNLIDNLTKHLQNKRYFIVIDDLWETTSWDILASSFPEGNNCSRIIATTEIEEVALECCDYQSDNILKMKPLGGEDSGKLLLNLVFGPERLCPEQLKGALDIIITRCAGLPLATICVSGLLTTQPDNPKLWQHVQDFLCSSLSTDCTLEDTLQEVLKLSYNSLPHYLKTCLMYLSVYPEGCTMWKFDLVKQWIAEGFICAVEGIDTGEVADSYFEELVIRGMIQPVDINYSGEVLSCTLHHVVLDLVTLESTEERFITTLDYSQTITGHYSKARWLSLHFSNPRYAKKPTGLTLSKARSIAFFGILKCVPTIVGFKHLRVLILEFWGDQQGITSFDLTGICRFFQLRYLKISCDASVEVELPTRMRMLRYLETLIIDAAVSAVPSDIVHLPGLLHLSLGDKTDLPDEIGRIRSLRALHCFDLSSNSEDSVLSLGDLLNLQDLNLTYCTEESDDHLKRNLAALSSSLGKLVNLKSVILAPGASGTAIYHDMLSSMSSLPLFLQRLELLPPICIFSRLPQCLGQLRKLCILTVVVSELLMEDMDILTGLPALTVFSLYVRQPTEESIIFKKRAFLGLKCFKYTCGVLPLTFQEEAFPNLQRLELSFNAHRGEHYHDFLSGIGYLLNLKEIAGTIGAATGAEESDRRVAECAFIDAIRKHPRFHSYDHTRRVDSVQEEYSLSDRRVAEFAFTDAIHKHPRFPRYDYTKKVDLVHQGYYLDLTGIGTISPRSSFLNACAARQSRKILLGKMVGLGLMDSVSDENPTTLGSREASFLRSEMRITDNLTQENSFSDESGCEESLAPHLKVGTMSFCCFCGQKLKKGEAIYIYQGDKAFCSMECRLPFLENDILLAKRKEKKEDGIEGPIFQHAAHELSDLSGPSFDMFQLIPAAPQLLRRQAEADRAVGQLWIDKFISLPKDMGALNCGAFVAGILAPYQGSLEGMTPMKVYGWAVSPWMARVLVCLEEAGAEYEFVLMSRSGFPTCMDMRRRFPTYASPVQSHLPRSPTCIGRIASDLKECGHFEWMNKYIRDRWFQVKVLPPIQGLPI
ncbi:disease resistance protein RGA5-like [Hordeum vulgare subsp. vulgare]|uniref:disease resistance protein RGA5-like n=1 Tax=Hordeum vulgare subsp. vulgare TaxID=112509 RepID=UPI001D1A3FA4|nr:disease resistance protein RGA5-like [Hordeum vulgare subsp. vulgare]